MDNQDTKGVVRSNVRPAPPLTPAMMRLAAHLLSMAGERFSNDGCTTLDLSQIEGFESHEARVALNLAYEEYNLSPGDHDPARVTQYHDNWCMMHLCAAALRKAAESSGKAEAAFAVLQEVLGIALVGLRSSVERHGADDQCLLNVEAGLRELGLDPDELHRGALRADDHVESPRWHQPEVRIVPFSSPGYEIEPVSAKAADRFKKNGGVGLMMLNDRGIHVRADDPTTRACEAAYLKAPPWLAERTILLIRAGSHANGVALPTSDIDLRGAAIAPRASYFGFLHRFEGFECKEPDCAVADIRFFMRAASEGEINALQVLFCDERDLLVCRLAGMTLRQMRASFISKRVAKPFAGFARGQIEKVKRGIERFPSQPLDDLAKSAMHAERIVRMLYEILAKGDVRVRRPDADWLVTIRQIKHRDRLLSVVLDTERELARLPEWLAASPLPDHPDYERLNRVCVELVSQAESVGAL